MYRCCDYRMPANRSENVSGGVDDDGLFERSSDQGTRRTRPPLNTMAEQWQRGQRGRDGLSGSADTDEDNIHEVTSGPREMTGLTQNLDQRHRNMRRSILNL